jgi:uncharacterized membrane protein
MGAERSRTAGMIICATTAFLGLFFTVGILRRSYMALAMPVLAGTLGVLYIAFWIGRALLTTPIEPPSDD